MVSHLHKIVARIRRALLISENNSAVLLGQADTSDRPKVNTHVINPSVEKRIQLGVKQAIAYAANRTGMLRSFDTSIQQHMPAFLNAVATVPALSRKILECEKKIAALQQEISRINNKLEGQIDQHLPTGENSEQKRRPIGNEQAVNTGQISSITNPNDEGMPTNTPNKLPSNAGR
jgi:hypothetical protein